MRIILISYIQQYYVITSSFNQIELFLATNLNDDKHNHQYVVHIYSFFHLSNEVADNDPKRCVRVLLMFVIFFL